jgi:hypothetical protein
MKTLLTTSLCVSLLTGLCLAQGPAQPTVAELLRGLASRNFKEREQAEKALEKRDDAAGALRLLLKSRDPDLAQRAGRILQLLAARDNLRALKQLQTLARQRKIEQVVHLLTTRPDWGGQEEQAFGVLSAFSRDLVARLKKQHQIDLEDQFLAVGSLGGGGRKQKALYLPWRDAPLLRKQVRGTILAYPGSDRVLTGPGGMLARGRKLSADQTIGYNVLACDQGFRGQKVMFSLLYANGPIEIERPFCTVIVGGGEVRVKEFCNRSLIIARGPIQFSRGSVVQNSVLVTPATVSCKDYPQWKNLIRPKEEVPLGLVHFEPRPKK